jgi:hypothetical protein
VCDNYKVPKFEAALKAKGFTQVETGPGVVKHTTLIGVFVEEKDFVEATEKVRRLSVKIEHDFKRSN